MATSSLVPLSALSANAGDRVVPLLGASKDSKSIVFDDSLFLDNSVGENGQSVSEVNTQKSSDRYKFIGLVQGSASFIAQTSDSSDIPITVERIRACLSARPQLYTLANVVNTATGKSETIAVPVKFNGDHGTIKLNANGKLVCPA